MGLDVTNNISGVFHYAHEVSHDVPTDRFCGHCWISELAGPYCNSSSIDSNTSTLLEGSWHQLNDATHDHDSINDTLWGLQHE